MALQQAKVWNINQQAVYFVTAGAADLPSTADFFNVGDWVVNTNPTMAAGDPILWVVTTVASGVTPTFSVLSRSPQVYTAGSAYTASTSSKTILAGAVTITLPAATTWPAGQEVAIRSLTSSTTVTPVSGNVNGVASLTLTAGQYARLIGDGTAYWQIG